MSFLTLRMADLISHFPLSDQRADRDSGQIYWVRIFIKGMCFVFGILSNEYDKHDECSGNAIAMDFPSAYPYAG